MDRKKFIYSFARFLIMSVFAGLIAFLFKRNKINAAGTCEVNKFCDGCRSFTNCSKPQAIKQKDNEKK